MIEPYNEILCRNKKEQNTHTRNSRDESPNTVMSKRSRTHRIHTVGFLSCEMRKTGSSYRSWGGEEVAARRHEGTFWGNGNVLHLDGGGGYISKYMSEYSLNCTLKMGAFLM